MEPFRVAVPYTVLDDLRLRLSLTRWPDEIEGAGWKYGTNREYLKQLAEYWQHTYNWQAQEARLNEFPQFKAKIGGSSVHFLHIQGVGPNPQPLLLTHGWPDSTFRFVKLIPMLTDPERFGGRAEDAFTVVAPSIPGFGFSDRPASPGCDTRTTADLFATLMKEVLGYGRFLAHGGDFGASVTEQLGLHHPDLLLGVHLNNVPPQHAKEAQADKLSVAEQIYLKHAAAWDKSEGAFTHVHSTKPQTLGAALNDSPIGLLAWILEKFQSWSDCDGDLERVYTKDDLLTNVMIYWVTQTITSSMRFYYEKAHRSGSGGSTYVPVPTAFASFANDIDPAPRKFAARFFNIQRWTEIPQGGHFAALEVPELLATDLRDFSRNLRGS